MQITPATTQTTTPSKNAVTSNLVRVNQQQPKQNSATGLPSVYMCNARSLINKLDEFELTVHQYKADVAIVTETWFSSAMPTEYLNVDKYTLFSTSRTDRRGGGVAVYIREDIQARVIPQVQVPPELECIWVWVRPNSGACRVRCRSSQCVVPTSQPTLNTNNSSLTTSLTQRIY
ncbi:hypothetical protein Bbelb_388760 [Branchiostoma belcheri]|nr:hypothetical protein Bbelb_388760 [Branchiostoma belcheri]